MAQSSPSREDSPVVHPDPPSMVEISCSSSSSSVDSVLRDVEDIEAGYEARYAPVDSFGSEFDSFERVLDEAVERIPFTGGSVSGVAASAVDAPLAATSGEPDRPSFTADAVALRVRNKDIIRAVKEGCIDGRWFEYLFPDVHFRTSMLPTRYLPVYTRAITAGMTLPVHPFVKEYCHFYDISPAQLAPNFWYCFAGAWILWHQRFDMDLPVDEFEKLILGTPSSSHGWKPMFFMIQGPFNFHPNDRLPRRRQVQVAFGNMVSQDRSKLSENSLARIEQAFSFPSEVRHIDTLLTQKNLRDAGLILDLPDPADLDAVRQYFHLSDEEMASLKIQLPGSQQSRTSQQPPSDQQPPPSHPPPSKGKEKASSSRVPKSRKTKGPSGSEAKTELVRKKSRREKTPMTETWTPTVLIPDVNIPLAPRERVLIPGAKIMDPKFQVSDISDAEIGAMLKLPPRFSLIFQALYESFLEPHWVAAAHSSLVHRKRKQISFQIHKLDDAVEKRDLALAKLASLEDELRKLKNEVASLKERADLSDKKLSEAVGEAEKRFVEGKTEGKREAEAEAAFDFDARHTEIIVEFKASQELTDIRTRDFQSAGQQIVDLIKKERPEWDLSFLYNSPPPVGDYNVSPPVGDDNVSPPGDGEDSATAGEA
ncbi:hypothetical protein L484_017007 [Morus notabilis]|uniref:Transposase (putative) gypsy type domain-containing protein n=1 Tax=Morus notabilis TaxID=981085 RepID=W9RWQ3_9ROSA|nr:hypothetical protein L484_017007 [Morus notabilis]